jgi:hypothetical protein
VTATYGSLKKSGAMGAAVLSKDRHIMIQALSMAVFGQQSFIRPELTSIVLAIEDCLAE